MGAVVFPLGVSLTGQEIRNHKRAAKALIGFTGTYATGGDTIPKAVLGLQSVDDLQVDAGFATAVHAGMSFALGGTPGAPTLKCYDAQGVEVANATNITTRQAVLTFLGT